MYVTKTMQSEAPSHPCSCNICYMPFLILILWCQYWYQNLLVNTRYVKEPKYCKIHVWNRVHSVTTQHTNWVCACIKPSCTTSTMNLPWFPINYKTCFGLCMCVYVGSSWSWLLTWCHMLWQIMCMMYFQDGFL